MKKRLFALSLSLLLLMTLLSGCGSSADGNTSSAASADLMMDSGAAYDTAAAETTEAAAPDAVFASDRAASTNRSGVPAALQNAKVILRANLDAETMAQLARDSCVGRNGRPEDVAKAMEYLADAQFVTGHVLNVDGGYVM